MPYLRIQLTDYPVLMDQFFCNIQIDEEFDVDYSDNDEFIKQKRQDE